MACDGVCRQGAGDGLDVYVLRYLLKRRCPLYIDDAQVSVGNFRGPILNKEAIFKIQRQGRDSRWSQFYITDRDLSIANTQYPA